MGMKEFLRGLKLWYLWFAPLPNWKQRVVEYRAGRRVWDLPWNPNAPKAVPFPVEWIPHRPAHLADGREVLNKGVVLLDAKCEITGKTAEVGVGVCCCRCGIDLHPDAAHMINPMSIPVCWRCSLVMI